MTHTYIHKILRDVDVFGLFVETMFRMIDDGWSDIFMFKIIKMIVLSCAHCDVIPVIETHRQLFMELARKVILAEIVSYQECQIVDPSKVIEFLIFMHKIAEDGISHLKFREELHENVRRACGSCHQRVKREQRGGRCGSCRVMNYCSRDCQKSDYIRHRRICEHWSSKMY